MSRTATAAADLTTPLAAGPLFLSRLLRAGARVPTSPTRRCAADARFDWGLPGGRGAGPDGGGGFSAAFECIAFSVRRCSSFALNESPPRAAAGSVDVAELEGGAGNGAGGTAVCLVDFRAGARPPSLVALGAALGPDGAVDDRDVASFVGPAAAAVDGRAAVAAAMCDRDDGRGASSPVVTFSL